VEVEVEAITDKASVRKKRKKSLTRKCKMKLIMFIKITLIPTYVFTKK